MNPVSKHQLTEFIPSRGNAKEKRPNPSTYGKNPRGSTPNPVPTGAFLFTHEDEKFIPSRENAKEKRHKTPTDGVYPVTAECQRKLQKIINLRENPRGSTSTTRHRGFLV